MRSLLFHLSLLTFLSTLSWAKPLTLAVNQKVDIVLADILNKDTAVALKTKATQKECLSLLKKHQVELAILQNDTAYHIYKGTGKESTPKLRVIVALYTKILTFITRKDSNITSLDDAQRKHARVSFAINDTETTCQTIFSDFDINCSIALTKFEYAKIYLQQDKISGFFTLQAHPSEEIQTLLKEQNITIVPLISKKMAQVKMKHDFFIKEHIPKEIYNTKDDIQSIGVKTLLVTTSDVSEEDIYKVTKTILNNLENFKKANPIYHGISKKTLLEGLTIPQHKGAIKAFNEH